MHPRPQTQNTPEGDTPESLSTMDRLNAQNMRWRLRRDTGGRGLEEGDQLEKLLKLEEDRLWELVAEVGENQSLGGLPIPDDPEDENVAASLYLHLKGKWEQGELRYFDWPYIHKAAREFDKKHNYRKFEGPRSLQRKNRDDPPPPAGPVENLEAPSDPAEPGKRRSEDREFYGVLLEELDSQEAYLLGWFLATNAEGNQGYAARAIDKTDPWATKVKDRLQEKAQRLRDRRTPKGLKFQEPPTNDPERM